MQDEALAAANSVRIAAYSKAFDLDDQEVVSMALGLLIDNLTDEETAAFGRELTKQLEKEN